MFGRIQSLQRAFRLLYLVAGREAGCSVRELADGAGLKPVTAYNIIRALETEGFLRRTTPPLRFHLGHAIQELKQLEDGRLLLSEASPELLKAQRLLPDVSFALLQWEEGETYQRISAEPYQFGRLIRRREYRVHSYEKASSLLFLAYASREEAASFHKKHPFEKEGIPVWKTQGALDRFLDKVRVLGWAQPDFPDAGLFRIAAPVWSSDGKIMAAVGAFAPEGEVNTKDRQKIVNLCRKIAQRLTKKLSQPRAS